MAWFIEGVDCGQSTLFPKRLEHWVGEDHLVRVVDLFVEELDLSDLGRRRSSPVPRRRQFVTDHSIAHLRIATTS
jgi:transposase